MDRSIRGLGSLLVRGLAIVVLALSACFAAWPPAAAYARTGTPGPGTVYALTADNRLLSFAADTPDRLTSEVTISGLQPGESLVGIDFRPATDRLYGVGSTSQLYVIDLATGFARPIGAPLTPALRGTQFGVDFNPVPDRLRIVSDNGQNLRVNPDTGAVVGDDAPLRYASGDVNAGKTPTIVGAAYTNPDNDPATGTQLFNIDAALGVFVLQDPPNDGVLTTRAPAPATITGLVTFDLGMGSKGLLAAQLNGEAASRLFRVDVADFSTAEVGVIGKGETVRGLAVFLGASNYERAYALNDANELLGFSPNRPNRIRTRVAISGLQPGESLVGIDFRPSTRRLYGVASSGQLYVINQSTGAASPIGTPFSPALTGTQFGVDFNPVPDRLRIVSDSGQNLRVNPDTGVVIGNDMPLRYADGDVNAGKTPMIVAAAYTNADNDPATGTQLFNIDAALTALVLQDPPNDGVLTTKAQVPNRITGFVAFDLGAGSQGLLAVQRRGRSASLLFRVDVASGVARPSSFLGRGEAVRGLAISPQ